LALRAADAVADAPIATILLQPFRIDDLDDEHTDSFGKIAGAYGRQWTAERLRTWFAGKKPAWAYPGGQERPRWIADRLPGLCARLHATGEAGVVAAQQLVDLAWEWTARDIDAALVSSWPSQREAKLGELARPLASVLTAAVALGAASTQAAVSGHLRKQGDAVTALEMPALRAAAKLARARAGGAAGFGELAADCAARLRGRLARPPRGRRLVGRAAREQLRLRTVPRSAPVPRRQDQAHPRMADRQGAQAAYPHPDRRRRAARHPRDQAARQPLRTRPAQDRRPFHR
jgi:hypothetical protein